MRLEGAYTKHQVLTKQNAAKVQKDGEKRRERQVLPKGPRFLLILRLIEHPAGITRGRYCDQIDRIFVRLRQ
jgi:hypothetical protein